MLRTVIHSLLFAAVAIVSILVGRLFDASTTMHGWGHSFTFAIGVWSSPLIWSLFDRKAKPDEKR
jgi:hypothetical protein